MRKGMRDQAHWERWIRQNGPRLTERFVSVKEWFREAGVEKGERRAFRAALKSAGPEHLSGKKLKKPPRRGKTGREGQHGAYRRKHLP